MPGVGSHSVLMTFLLGLVSPADFAYRDGFDYPEGSEGPPAWFATTVAWEVHGGKMRCTGGHRSVATLERPRTPEK